ncbi:uncharacterized protein LOC143291754 isoform X11 [Babylonia areolata]|uniref:uncharacterized protein LOC143291754 isoform X11 n=1 Tax=Babylonia areolata TaxID=304850 RepID=UPI003FD39004
MAASIAKLSLTLLLQCSLVQLLWAGFTAKAFHGYAPVTQIECTGGDLNPDLYVLSIVIYVVQDDHVLASANVGKEECSTSGAFSSCVFEGRDSRRTRVRTLVTRGMRVEEGWRVFGCNLTSFRTGGRVATVTLMLTVDRERTTTTVAPTTTTTTTTTIKPQPRSESPVASGVKSNVQEFQLPISVVIIGLVLLLFFAILCAILVILQCRGKRRRRSRAANRESLLSAKNEPMGEGGYRTPRNIPSYPPGHMPPETPGGNFAMRYQKSIPDTGYVSGSSVYYSEPYGTLDEEMKERLRPNPRMCHIPYDIKGGPLDTSHPQEHSA